MELHGFADLWEHVRLLSDRPRNDALVSLLTQRAPGARVLEVGCGTGLLSCVAARAGATQVYAVEPTAQAEVARALVQANGLDAVVTVLQAPIEDLPPHPVDLAFSELLNADPFAEGVLEAAAAAARWVVPGGHLAPSHLRLYAALVSSDTSAAEVDTTRRVLAELGQQHHLDLSALSEALDDLDPYPYIAPAIRDHGPGVCIADLTLGVQAVPPEPSQATLPWPHDTPATGVAVWFEADLDDGVHLHNRPHHPGHWGHLILGWPHPVHAINGWVPVEVDLTDGEILVVPERP